MLVLLCYNCFFIRPTRLCYFDPCVRAVFFLRGMYGLCLYTKIMFAVMWIFLNL
jgi:hypothetical protein